MGKPTREEAARAITDIVRNAKLGKATGPYLGSILKYKLDDFRPQDFGAFNLKGFIEQFVPEVSIRVISKTEVEFALDGATATAAGEPTTPEPSMNGASAKELVAPRVQPSSPNEVFRSAWLPENVWSAFVAGSSPKRVHIKKQTGEMSLEPVGFATAEGSVCIQPLPTHIHIEIAHDFSDKIPLDHRAHIDSLVGAGPGWWKKHFAALDSLGLGSAYKKFHSGRVFETIDKTVRDAVGRGLKELRLPDGGVVPPYAPPPKANAGTGVGAVRQPAREHVNGDDLLRSFAERLVRNMSRAELRRISVSLGDVLDLL